MMHMWTPRMKREPCWRPWSLSDFESFAYFWRLLCPAFLFRFWTTPLKSAIASPRARCFLPWRLLGSKGMYAYGSSFVPFLSTSPPAFLLLYRSAPCRPALWRRSFRADCLWDPTSPLASLLRRFCCTSSTISAASGSMASSSPSYSSSCTTRRPSSSNSMAPPSSSSADLASSRPLLLRTLEKSFARRSVCPSAISISSALFSASSSSSLKYHFRSSASSSLSSRPSSSSILSPLLSRRCCFLAASFRAIFSMYAMSGWSPSGTMLEMRLKPYFLHSLLRMRFTIVRRWLLRSFSAVHVISAVTVIDKRRSMSFGGQAPMQTRTKARTAFATSRAPPFSKGKEISSRLGTMAQTSLASSAVRDSGRGPGAPGARP
mmetsp:Transcript_14929/g.56663  ORF Transcript_14929/g.56663 Transcript_14929/m.56663 type:complete len:376 (-) Transcript_14929:2900-4027(-)